MFNVSLVQVQQIPGAVCHTMERIVDFVCCAPMVPLLGDPVPQTVETAARRAPVLRQLSTVPEQVIEVPKILPEDVPLRAVLRDTQLVEQLVEVPTIVSYSWLQLRVEQNVDIPAPGRGGRFSGLQGFLPGQSSTAQLAAQERVVGGGLQDFQAVQGSAASSSVSPGQAGEAVLRTFPHRKKSVKIPRTQGSELGAESSSWTP